jgi:hypothetical protein
MVKLYYRLRFLSTVVGPARRRHSQWPCRRSAGCLLRGALTDARTTAYGGHLEFSQPSKVQKRRVQLTATIIHAKESARAIYTDSRWQTLRTRTGIWKTLYRHWKAPESAASLYAGSTCRSVAAISVVVPWSRYTCGTQIGFVVAPTCAVGRSVGRLCSMQ